MIRVSEFLERNILLGNLNKIVVTDPHNFQIVDFHMCKDCYQKQVNQIVESYGSRKIKQYLFDAEYNFIMLELEREDKKNDQM